MRVPERLKDLPQASARMPAAMPWAEPPLVLVHLVADEQVEEPLQPVLHVVREGVALRPRGVRLPEGGAALVAGALPAGEILHGQGQPSLSTIGAKQSGQQGTRNGSRVSSSRTSLPSTAAQRSTTAGSQR